MFKRISIIITLSIFSLIIFSYLTLKSDTNQQSTSPNKSIIKIAGHSLTVEVADDQNEQELGLSYRKFLGENNGMLFVFPQPIIPNFWMKDMNFSLDMIWIDANKKIIGITKDISPDTYPKTFSYPSFVKYVLEVNAGWSDRNKIKVGDQISL